MRILWCGGNRGVPPAVQLCNPWSRSLKTEEKTERQCGQQETVPSGAVVCCLSILVGSNSGQTNR